MNNFEDLHRQYQNDPAFHAVVTVLARAIQDTNLTPFEVRQAAFYASCRHEMNTARAMKLTGEKQETT